MQGFDIKIASSRWAVKATNSAKSCSCHTQSMNRKCWNLCLLPLTAQHWSPHKHTRFSTTTALGLESFGLSQLPVSLTLVSREVRTIILPWANDLQSGDVCLHNKKQFCNWMSAEPKVHYVYSPERLYKPSANLAYL